MRKNKGLEVGDVVVCNGTVYTIEYMIDDWSIISDGFIRVFIMTRDLEPYIGQKRNVCKDTVINGGVIKTRTITRNPRCDNKKIDGHSDTIIEGGVIKASTITNGLKYDDKKVKYRLIPSQVTEALACIFTYGLKKYKKEGSWKEVSKSRYQDALMRHFQDYMKDNGLDESGFPHSFHVLWNAGALVYKDLEEMGIDTKENLWEYFNEKRSNGED